MVRFMVQAVLDNKNSFFPSSMNQNDREFKLLAAELFLFRRLYNEKLGLFPLCLEKYVTLNLFLLKKEDQWCSSISLQKKSVFFQ